MKNFLKRNAPVFVIGFVMLVLFLIAIISSENKSDPSNLPNLIRVRDEEEEEIFFEPPPEEVIIIEETESSKLGYKEEEDIITNEERRVHDERTTLNSEEVKARYGVLEINFTSEGFEPRNTNGYIGQIVRFNNNTGTSITIQQTTPKYDFWENPRTIPAGSSLEFEATEKGLWTYLEQDSNKLGAIYFSAPFRQ
jgi:hypothetical protein